MLRHRRPVIAILLTIALSACGEPQQPESNTAEAIIPAVDQAAAASPSQPATPTAAQDNETTTEVPPAERALVPEQVSKFVTRTGDMDAMIEARVIRILTVYSPGQYYLDDGQEKGIVAEMAGHFEDAINKSLDRGHLRVHVVVIPMARDQLLPSLLAGKGDIIVANLSITPERQEIIDFSIPSTKPLSEILVTGPSAPAVQTIEDLSGQTVYVRESSSYRESVEQLNERLTSQGKDPVQIELLSELLEDDDLIEMVNGGLLPWVIVDDYKVQFWDGVFTKLTVRDDIVFRDGGRIGWAFRKDSPKLAKGVNAFLKKNREGTLLGNVLRNRYIRDFDWAANALNKEDYERLEALVDIFKKHGEVYEVEYLMAAAQGYQESRLDQNVRSHAGAIGVMQLLPSTASDPKVGIPNIHEVDANIEAGIKYLDYLRTRYFDDPDIDNINQHLLALGAYNAGPARMINLRRKAQEQGYDPNVWFDNVEIIAAQEIGRETVQYVANIYKYYLAYSLSFRTQVERNAARSKAGIE
ncbi:MAG: lytic transglycosylase F [Halieaceae bacterium]